MTERLEQRYCIKFCQKLGDTQAETIRKIQQVFGHDTMSITQIKEWYNRFKDGRVSVESESRSGRPSTSRNDEVIEQVRTLVMQDRRVTIQEIVDQIEISFGSVQSILKEDLGLRRVSAKFVPKLLTMEQKQLRLQVSQDMLDCSNSNPNFLNIVITGDESWVYGYDPETKMQSSQWRHPSTRGQKRQGRFAATSKSCWQFSLTAVGWCIMSTHHKAKTLPKNITRRSSVIFVMPCDANDQTCGKREIGSSIMTTRPLILHIWFRLSWPSTTSLWFVRLPTLPTWLLVIFGYSPSWNCLWKGADLSHERTLCRTRRLSCTPFPKRLSRNASSNGVNAGRNVCSPKESILKGIRVLHLQVSNCVFPGQMSDTFWSHLVCCTVLILRECYVVQ